jgi:hypothetical protein
MKLFLTIVIYTLIVNSSLISQVLTFEKHFGYSLRDAGRAVIETKDGNFIITGNTEIPALGRVDDVLIAKVDGNGDTLWLKAFGGTGFDGGFSIVQTIDRGFIIAGYVDGNLDSYFIKTDSNGVLQWSKVYSFGGYESAFSVKELTSRDFIIVGYADSCGVISKVNLLGDTLWSKKYCNSRTAFGDIQLTADGNFILGGSLGNGFYLTKTDTLGEILWAVTDTLYGYAIIRSITEATDGSFLSVGQTRSRLSGSHWDIMIVKLSSDGNIVWEKTYGDTSITEDGRTIQQTLDNNYFILANKDSKVYVLKLNSQGDTLWTRQYGQPGNAYATCSSGELTNDGGIIITGTYYPNAPNQYSDVYLLKIDSSGAVQVEEHFLPRPTKFTLNQNYPNPFNPITVISFSLPVTSIATLKVYNILGQEVATLINNKELHAGIHEITFDANKLSSGLYFYKLTAHQGESSTGEFSQVKRMILLK